MQEHNRAVEAVKRWLDTHDQWLLIFDNADDIMTVYDFLPSMEKGYILLTTRIQAYGTIVEGIEVKQMGLENGALLLLRRAKMLSRDETLDKAASDDRELAEEIVQELGGLPLALDQAGAFIEEI